MNLAKKITVVLLAALFFASTASVARAEDDTMQVVLKDSLYGGVIGALIGTAIVLVTDDPEDNLEYIPTGAGIGIIAGAAYGIASTGVVQSISEVDATSGEFALNMPTFKKTVVYNENTHQTEVINSMDLFKLKF